VLNFPWLKELVCDSKRSLIFDGERFKIWLSVVSNLTKLEKLNISMDGLCTTEQRNTLISALLQTLPQLKIVEVSDPYIFEEFDERSSHNLLECCGEKKLERLFLPKNLGAEGAAKVPNVKYILATEQLEDVAVR